MEVYKNDLVAAESMHTMQALRHIPLFLDHYQKERYEDALKSVHKFEGAQRVWVIHACLAASYGQLKNTEKASAEIAQLLALRPEFHKDAAGYLQRFFGSSEGVDALLDGLRKAGLDIPNESVAIR